MGKSSVYDLNSIETLSFKDGVRKRISMYLGSNDMQGVYQGLQEIISNSIDEFLEGYGDKIEITLFPDNTIGVRDYGRGVPFGIKEDGTNTMEAIYSRAHTGGKFSESSYQFSAGLNGIGAKATCLSAETFNAISIRDGKVAAILFNKGNLVDYQEQENKDGLESGTYVKYKPDSEVYYLEPIKFDFDYICETCKSLSYLTKGLKFELKDENTGRAQTYFCKKGLEDLILNLNETPIHSTVLTNSLEDENGSSIEIALQWTKGKERSFCFTNGVLNTEGGTPITGLKRAITNNFKKAFKTEISGDMARTGLIYAVSCKVHNPSFANQTKTKVNNPELNSLAYKCFTEAFENFKTFYPNELKKLEDFLVREKKAEEAAERAREKVLQASKDIENISKKRLLLADKLKDCKVHGENSILCICEGDSALGALAKGRNIDTQALIPIRGKIISALKNTTEDVLANEEVKVIFSTLGCGFFDKYNTNKLRFGKVGVAADQDQDGNNIFVLVATLFYFMCPEFLKEGRLYRIQSPLYILRYKKEIKYAFSNEEKENLLKKYGRNCEVSRIKGLGELRAQDTKEAVFGNSKRWDKLEFSDWDSFVEKLYLIMGKEVPARRDYIMNNVDFSRVEE